MLLIAFLWYTTSAERALVARNYRALGAMAGQIDGVVEATGVALRTRAASVDPCPRPLDGVAMRCSDEHPPKHTDQEGPACPAPGDVCAAFDGGASVLFRVRRDPPSGVAQTTARLSLDDLAASLDPYAVFDEVLIVDRESKAHARWQLRGAFVGSIDPLFEAWTHQTSAFGWQRDLGVADEKAATSAAQTPQHALSPGRVESVRWQDQEQLLFAQPLRIQGGDRFVLCGLAEKTRFDRTARRLPATWAVRGVVLLLMALLGWPLVKLWSLGPRDRLTPTDLRVLTVGIITGAGVATILLLAKGFGDGLHAERARENPLTAANLDRAIAKLEHIGREHLAVVDETLPTQSELPATIEGLPSEIIAAFDRTGLRRGTWRQQASKRFTRQTTAESFRIDDRRYFRALVDDDGCRSDGRIEREMVRSKLTGRMTLILATCRRRGTESTVWVVSLDPSRIDVSSSRDDSGIAVVDETGLVLLHSTPSRALVENLLQEVDDAPALHAALTSLQPAQVDARYFGQPTHFYVQPSKLEHSSWRIVVFDRRSLVEALDTEVLAVAGWLFLAWLGLGIVVMMVVQIVAESYRADWLWPDRSHRHVVLMHVVVAAALTLVAITALRAACTTCMAAGAWALAAASGSVGTMMVARARTRLDTIVGPPAVFGAVALLAGSASCTWLELLLVCSAWVVVGLALRFQPSGSRQEPVSEWQFRFSYALVLLSLTGVLAVVPATLCFEHSRIAMTRELAPPPPAFPPSRARSEAIDPLLAAAYSHLPTITEAGLRMRLSAQHGRTDGGGWSDPNAPLVLGIGAAVLLFGLLWSIARHVFVLDADVDFDSHERDLSKRLPLWEVGMQRHSSIPTATCDLGGTTSPEELRQRLETGRTTHHRFTNLEWVLDDDALRRVWIEWLETLPENEPVLFDSLVDPLAFIPRWLDELGETEDAAGLRRRWLRLTRRLEVGMTWLSEEAFTKRNGAAGYPILWQLSSQGERTALRQFALEGLLNPGDLESSRSLLRRGLVRRTPAFEFFDDAFGCFVRRAKHEEPRAQPGDQPSDWTRMQPWLVAGAGVVGTLFVLIAPDILNSSIAVLTALTGGLPILMQLFSLLGENKAPGGASHT